MKTLACSNAVASCPKTCNRVNEGGVIETVLKPIDGILISTPPSVVKIREAVPAIEELNRSALHPIKASLHSRDAFMDRLTEVWGEKKVFLVIKRSIFLLRRFITRRRARWLFEA